MFDRLLVPLDGSLPATAALFAAERLADRWDADLTVLTILAKGDNLFGLDEVVRRQADRIGRERTVDIREMSYSVVDDIASVFDEVDSTLVVMSTWARDRRAGLEGNVAEDVLRHIRKPMLLLGPADEIADDWPRGQLLVCVDGTDFAASVVPLAAQWAEALNLDPMIVGVADTGVARPGDRPPGETNALARAASELKEVVGREVGYDALHGSDPAKAIVDYVEHNPVAIVAIATHSREGVDRLLHGSVAMRVVRAVHCPVLVTRPPVDPHH